MASLHELVAGLGGTGARRNVEDALAHRREQDRAVDALLERLGPVEVEHVVTPAA